MTPYTFKDIEVFLLDDDFFQWAKYGYSNNGFDIDLYKLQYPGCEEKIELAAAMILISILDEPLSAKRNFSIPFGTILCFC